MQHYNVKKAIYPRTQPIRGESRVLDEAGGQIGSIAGLMQKALFIDFLRNDSEKWNFINSLSTIKLIGKTSNQKILIFVYFIVSAV